METRFCKRCNKEHSIADFKKVITKSGQKRFKCKSKYTRLAPTTASGEYEVGSKEYVRELQLMKYFKITLVQYKEMFNKQEGCCAICEVHQLNLGKSLSVDHCHITGKVRGLLCSRCNFALGGFKDSIDLLNGAIDYLNKNKTI